MAVLPDAAEAQPSLENVQLDLDVTVQDQSFDISTNP